MLNKIILRLIVKKTQLFESFIDQTVAIALPRQVFDKFLLVLVFGLAHFFGD